MVIPGETFLLVVVGAGGVIGTPTLTCEGRIFPLGLRDGNHFWNDDHPRD